MKKYQKILFDQAFIEWRLFHTEEQDSYWAHFREEHPESREALDKAIRQFNAVKFNNFELAESEQEKLYQRIWADIHRSRMRRRRVMYWSAAASIALLVVSSFFFILQPRNRTQQDTPNIDAIIGQAMPSNDIRLITGEKMMDLKQNAQITLKERSISVVEEADVSEIPLSENMMNKLMVPAGKRSTLQLADGTKIWLNSGTELVFPSEFEGNTREISMKGEIYIEVTKGQKPFYVNTSQFKVRVHGTTFNISAYGDNEENTVVLVEGAVEVVIAGQEPAMLASNEKATVSTDMILKTTVNVNEYTSWKDGVLMFNQTPISEVLKKIGRYYNVNFEDHSGNELSTKTCTGKLFLSEDFDEIMISLSVLSATQYHKDDSMIYLKKE
jgi:ferric-dicitrate binding protein FerR (iron transport regulator)